MRKILGTRLLFSLTAVAAIGVWAACGGSDPQDVVTTDAGSDTGSNNDKDSGDGNDSGGNKDTGAPDTGPPPKVYDAGTPNVLDSGDIDGGIPCVIGGELEDEPNDNRVIANELKPTRCGAILVKDAGPEDTDFLTFQLADASTSFYVQYAGKVTVHVETDGQAPVDITAPDAGSLKFFKGQPYFVQVRSADGKTQVWRVSLFQE